MELVKCNVPNKRAKKGTYTGVVKEFMSGPFDMMEVKLEEGEKLINAYNGLKKAQERYDGVKAFRSKNRLYLEKM